jgi:hypothetical protein
MARPAADALTGLGILQHRVVVVDLVLNIFVAGLRSGPVPIQRGSVALIFHVGLLCFRRYRFPHRACIQARTCRG